MQPQGQDTYRLVVRRGPQPNQVYDLKEDVVNLGRDITNNIVINDREVSRHHLRFMRGPEGYTIEDLGSTNGTFVNGKRVTGAAALKNGDMIGLGETVTLGYELVRPDAAMSGNTPPPQSAPQPIDDGPYQPAQGGQQLQPAYQPQPQPADPYQPSADPYQPQPVDPYQQGVYGQADYAQGEAYQQPAYAGADPRYAQQQGMYAPPPGYGGIDPYELRQDEGGGIGRILLFGCIGLMLFCCCITIFGAVLVDALCLYDNLPFLVDVLEALGVTVNC